MSSSARRSRRRLSEAPTVGGLCAPLAAALVATAGLATAEEREGPPVKHLASHVYVLIDRDQHVKLPMEMSADPTIPHPEITRAVVVFHGKGRNVEGYYGALADAAHHAGKAAAQTLLLAPQFLREEDVHAHRLPAEFLRWHLGAWSAGLPAAGPVALSSFDVIDAIVNDLADRARFPNLTSIVLIGHSGGGQLLNRYAIVGTRTASLAGSGIHVRYVIANPSSYFYFSDERPQRDGTFAPYRADECPGFNHWRYGPASAPPYVTDVSAEAWQRREQSYASSDVVYLLGTEDADPEQRDLDTSCAGEAEGPERLSRGQAYFRYLSGRHAQDFHQQLWLVSGVAHSGERMLDSPCGIAAMFEEHCAAAASEAPR
jgi:hypothetical protein